MGYGQIRKPLRRLEVKMQLGMQFLRKIILLIVILALILQINIKPMLAEEYDKLAVMLIVDQINLEDLQGDYPNFHKLMEKGLGFNEC